MINQPSLDEFSDDVRIYAVGMQAGGKPDLFTELSQGDERRWLHGCFTSGKYDPTDE